MVARLIDEVLAGELPPEMALEDWPRSEPGDKALINAAWTALQHFADDEDIHRVDAEYLEAERNKLKEYASRLRAHVGTDGE